jgi:hypothetical protein
MPENLPESSPESESKQFPPSKGEESILLRHVTAKGGRSTTDTALDEVFSQRRRLLESIESVKFLGLQRRKRFILAGICAIGAALTLSVAISVAPDPQITNAEMLIRTGVGRTIITICAIASFVALWSIYTMVSYYFEVRWVSVQLHEAEGILEEIERRITAGEAASATTLEW